MKFEKPASEEQPTESSSEPVAEIPAMREAEERKSAEASSIPLMKSKFRRLLLGAAVLLGAEHAAAAGTPEKDERPAERVDAKMADGKDVTYLTGTLPGGAVKVGGVKQMKYSKDFAGVFVTDKGDPKTEMDDREVQVVVQRTVWEDGRTTYGSPHTEYKNGGLKNPFATIEYNPDFERDEIAGKPKEAWGADLEGIGNEYWGLKGFEAAGKGDTAEAKHLRADLQKGLIEFQKEYPKVAIDKDKRDDVMGLK